MIWLATVDVDRERSGGWNDEDNENGIDVPERLLKRETEDGAYMQPEGPRKKTGRLNALLECSL